MATKMVLIATHWRQWWWTCWRRWCPQSPLAPMTITIGARGDHHWWPMVQFKWHHWRHFVAMPLPVPQSPMKANGINDGNIGNIGDPLVQMAIHWLHWRHGTNNSKSTGVIGFNVQWHVWNVESPFSGAIGAYDATSANETIVAIGVIVGIGATVWLYDECVIIVSKSNGSSLSPLAPLLPLTPLVSLMPPTFFWCLNLYIATKWCQWSHLNGAIDHQWRSS